MTTSLRQAKTRVVACVVKGLLAVLAMPVMTNAQDQGPTGPTQIPMIANGNRAQDQKTSSLGIEVDPKADEQLFMLRKLEFLYSQWPTQLANQELVSRQLADVRRELVRGKEYAKAKGMEERLVTTYSDSIEIADRYGELLADFGAIDRDHFRKLKEAGEGGGLESAVQGFGLGQALAQAGIEPISATLILSGYAIKRAWDGYQQGQQLDEQRATALQIRLNQYLIERSRLLGRIEVQAGVLAEKLHWGVAEVGFDQNEVESTRVQEATERGDVKFLLQRAEQLKEARPRDPFVYAASGWLCMGLALRARMADWDDFEGSLWNSARREFQRAAQLVPTGRFHDPLRTESIWLASESATRMLYYTNNKDDLPIQLADAALGFQPRDPEGRIAYTKSYALARNGRFEESLALFEKCAAIRGEDSSLLYDWACLLSLANKPEAAFSRLRESWLKGSRDVRWIRKDRDLTNLRTRLPDAFAEMVKPKWSWGISYGMVWNDVSITNNSEFPLTGLAMKVVWEGNDGRKYEEVYWANEVPVGSTHAFQGALSRATQATEKRKECIAASCEETRSVARISIKDAQGKYGGDATLMKIDGSSIKTSESIGLVVSDKGDGKVRLELTGPVSMDLPTVTLLDGRARSDPESGTTQNMQIVFTGQSAYGWCQTPADAGDGTIWAFWVDKSF